MSKEKEIQKFKMPELVMPTQQIANRPLLLTLSGYPGQWKTTTAFTAEKPLLFDFDKGIDRAEPTFRCPYYNIPDYGAFKEQMVMTTEFADLVRNMGIKTIILDTVGAMLEDSITPWLISIDGKYAQRDGSLSQKGWGQLQSEFNSLINRFWGLGLDVVAVCHAKEEGGKDDGSKSLRLAVKGGSNEIITRKSDMLGFIKMVRKERVLDFNASDEQIGKNTGGFAPLTVPDVNTIQYQTFLADIFTATRRKMQTLTATQVKVNDQIEEVAEKVAACESIAALLILQVEIDALSQIVALQCTQHSATRFVELFFASEGNELPAEHKKLTAFFQQTKEQLSILGIENVYWKKAISSRISQHAKELGYKYDAEKATFVKLKASDEATT